MPPLSGLPTTIYSTTKTSREELFMLTSGFEEGTHNLLTTVDVGSGNSVEDSKYFFTPVEVDQDYQLPIVYGMMSGVIKGAVIGEFFPNEATYEAMKGHTFRSTISELPESTDMTGLELSFGKTSRFKRFLGSIAHRD